MAAAPTMKNGKAAYPSIVTATQAPGGTTGTIVDGIPIKSGWPQSPWHESMATSRSPQGGADEREKATLGLETMDPGQGC